MKRMFVSVFILISVWGCKTIEEDNTELDPQEEWLENKGKEDLHTSQNSLDWDGTYTGVLPCKDCPGIETFLTINEDLSYSVEQRNLETTENKSEDYKNTGVFMWNDEGSIISVETMDGELKLKVEELFLVPVDANGVVVKAERGNNFKLLKQ